MRAAHANSEPGQRPDPHGAHAGADAFPRPHRIALLAVLALGLPVLWYLAHAAALRVPLQHVDGAYQTIAMLRHLSDGELPGRDFFPYLGIGIPLLLWPAYWAGGSTLVASQAAAIFGGLVATFAGGTLLGALALRAAGVHRPTLLALGIGLLLLCIAIPGSALLHSIVMPGASLYSLRSALVYVVAAGVWLAVRDGRWHAWRSAAVTAVALMWSNDFAFAGVLFLHVMLVLHVATVDRLGTALRAAALSLVGGLLGYALLGSLVTGGHLADLLRYNFGAVAADQHWYFGPYARSDHYLTLGDLAWFWYRNDVVLTGTLLGSIGFGVLLLTDNARRNRATMAVGAACMTAFVAGLVSEFGGHKAENYHQMTVHLLPLLAFVTLVPGTQFGATPAGERAQRWLVNAGSRLRTPLELGVLGALLLAAIGAITTAHAHRDALAHDRSMRHASLFGGYLPVATANEFARVQRTYGNAPADVVSAYLNPYDLLLPHRQRAPTDSIIHALGWLRPQFVQALADPRVQRAVTTNASSAYSIDRNWENWSIHENWPFYRTLVERYTPGFTGTRLVLWTRARSALQAGVDTSMQARPDARTEPAVHTTATTCIVRRSAWRTRIVVQDQRAGDIHDLALRYRVQCDDAFARQRVLVLARAASRRDHLGGMFSLPPSGEARAPHLPLDVRDALYLEASPRDHCSITVLACSATRIDGVGAAARAALGLPADPRAGSASPVPVPARTQAR